MPCCAAGASCACGRSCRAGLPVGVAAGAAVEVFSKDAIEHYERARDLLTEVRTGSRQLTEPSVPDLEHLYIQLGRAYELLEEWDKAREAYEAMLALAREVEEARLEVGASPTWRSSPSTKSPTPEGRGGSWRSDGWPRRRTRRVAGRDRVHPGGRHDLRGGGIRALRRSRPEGSGLRSDLGRASGPDREGTGDAGTSGAGLGEGSRSRRRTPRRALS